MVLGSKLKLVSELGVNAVIGMQGVGIVMSVTGALILVHVENLDFQKCVQAPAFRNRMYI